MPRQGIAADSVFLTLVKVVTAAVSLVVTKIMSTQFSLADYGFYSQVNLIISTATSLSILGLTDGANYFYNIADDDSERRRSMNTVFAVQLVIGTICAFSILLFGDFLTNYFGNPELNRVYVWIAFEPMLANLLAMYQVLFISAGKARLIAMRNLVISLIRLCIIALAAYAVESVLTIFVLLLLTDAAQVLFFAITFGRMRFPIKAWRPDPSKVKAVLSYCLPLAAYILTTSFLRDIDKYVVSWFADTESFAVFSNCAKVLPFDMLTTSFATVMIPYVTRYIAQERYEEAQKLYRNYLSLAYVTTWTCAFGAIVCASDLMRILYDEKYLSGVAVFAVYVGVDMLRFANVAVILRAKGKTKSLMAYAIVALSVNVVLSIFFYRMWGMVGPAIATLVITFGMNATMLAQGSRILHCRVSSLMSSKELVSFSVGLISAGLVAYVVSRMLTMAFPGIHFVLRFLLSYGSYFAILVLANGKKVLHLMKEINSMKA